MSLLDRFRKNTAEVTTLSVTRERPPTAEDQHPDVILSIGGVRFRVEAGDFSKALAGVGEVVRVTLMTLEK